MCVLICQLNLVSLCLCYYYCFHLYLSLFLHLIDLIMIFDLSQVKSWIYSTFEFSAFLDRSRCHPTLFTWSYILNLEIMSLLIDQIHYLRFQECGCIQFLDSQFSLNSTRRDRLRRQVQQKKQCIS